MLPAQCKCSLLNFQTLKLKSLPADGLSSPHSHISSHIIGPTCQTLYIILCIIHSFTVILLTSHLSQIYHFKGGCTQNLEHIDTIPQQEVLEPRFYQNQKHLLTIV